MDAHERLIRQMAKQRGLDPDAVVAIGSVEGKNALHGGVSIGDNGTSFGFAQLHRGGALPAGKGSEWAHSRAGIAYALDGMAKVARGLTGEEAVAAISSKFERPADVPGEIAKAMGYYGKAGGADTTALGASGPRSNSQAPALGGLQDNRAMVTSMLFGSAQMLAAGQKPDLSALLSLSVVNNQLGGHEVALASEGRHGDAGVVATVRQALGTPYVWGGEKPGGFDCSGLLQYAWAKHGVSIPRTTYDQFQTGQKVATKQLAPGDAVFFTGSDPKGNLPGHVGMYVDHGKFIEAPGSGKQVRVSNLADRSDFVGARRFK